MNIMTRMTDMARSEGDPKVLRSGPSSLGTADRLAKALGWFSIGLGVSQLLAAPRYTRAFGVEGKEWFVRAAGAREITHGLITLSPDKKAGLWSRVGGDIFDIAVLAAIMRPDNPKRDNVGKALAAVIGVTLLDIAGAQAVTARHSRRRGQARDYSDRSGFPQGVAEARGAAADFEVPSDMTAALQSPKASKVTGRSSKASAAIAEPPSMTH
jgi:hypothetical protein